MTDRLNLDKLMNDTVWLNDSPEEIKAWEEETYEEHKIPEKMAPPNPNLWKGSTPNISPPIPQSNPDPLTEDEEDYIEMMYEYYGIGFP